MDDRQELAELEELDALERKSGGGSEPAPMAADNGQKTAYLSSLEAKYSLPRGLLDSVWQQESSRGVKLLNPKSGAAGDFQFMPATAKSYGVDVKDFKSSADGAAKMFSDLSKQYKGDLPSMLAAYNWGSGNLANHGMSAAPKETQDYITEIAGRMPQRQPTYGESIKRQLGLTGRAVAEGASQIADIPANVMNLGGAAVNAMFGSDETAGNVAPTLTPKVSEGLTGMGIPQPADMGERLGQMVGQGMVGGAPWGAAGMAAGGLGMGSGQLAKEAGAGPIGQTVAGLAGGLAATPSTLTGIVKSAPRIAAQDVKTLSSQAYKTAEAKGGTLSSDFVNRYIDTVDQMKAKTPWGEVGGGGDTVKQVQQDLQKFRGQPASLDAAQEFDEKLGELIDRHTVMGKLDKQGHDLHEMQSNFRQMIENAGVSDITGGKEGFEALKDARKMWSAQRKMSDIEKIITRASQSPNEATALQNGFKTLYNSPKRMRGFTAEEQKLIKKAAEGNPVVDLLKSTLGSRLGPIIHMATGGGLGSTAAGAAASMAARGGAARLQLGKALKINDKILQDLPKYLGKDNAAKLQALVKAGKPVPPSMLGKLPPAVAIQLIGDKQ